MTERTFEGRVAIVTGAGGGLGRSYALELARRGAKLVVNDLAHADEVVAQIVEAGGEAVASHDSVGTRTGGGAVVDAALDRFGRVDILISNAGILRTARFEEMTDADIDDVIDVHLKGAFYVGQPAFAAMKRQGYGRILFTASSSGLFGHPWQASYGAAKSGIAGLSNIVALEGKAHGVLCNAIMPNAQTPLTAKIDWSWAQDVPEIGALLEQVAAAPGGDRLDPDWVTPLAIALVSEGCTLTRQLFSASSGRFARVFTAAARGWTAPALPSAEDVAAHWDMINDPTGFIEPQTVYHEVLAAREALAGAD